MGVCDLCKVETELLFKCIHCGAFLCNKHRLPENHLCVIEKNPPNHIKNNNEIPIIFQNEEKTHKKQDKQRTIPSRISHTVPILLLILSVSTLYSVYVMAYNVGYNNAYNAKNDEGEQVGYQTGYNQGFEDAFLIGNHTGYKSGFFSGTVNGEATGYQQRYSEGENIGENMGFIEGNHTAFLEYYQYGLDDIENRRYNISYPSYPRVSSFIKNDETDREWYISGIFDDHDFAQKVKDNAFKHGIHCYYVELQFAEPPGHAIVAFNTMDRGLVFYEPQTDECVIVEIGIRYWRDRGLNTNRDDSIIGIEFVW